LRTKYRLVVMWVTHNREIILVWIFYSMNYNLTDRSLVSLAEHCQPLQVRYKGVDAFAFYFNIAIPSRDNKYNLPIDMDSSWISFINNK